MTTLRELITEIQDNRKVDFWATEYDDHISLDKIIVYQSTNPQDPNFRTYRGEGRGTNAMRKLCDYADSVGKPVKLVVHDDFGGDIDQLKAWYADLTLPEDDDQDKIWFVDDGVDEDGYPKMIYGSAP